LIGISLSKRFEKVFLTDISQKALNVAKKNVIENNTSNVDCLKSDVLSSKQLQREIAFYGTWTLVANLPYVPSGEQKDANKFNVEHEPALALYSGKDGLDCFRELIKQLEKMQNKPMDCYFELDPGHIHKAYKLLKDVGYSCDILKDQGGLDRFLIGV
jgi:release factor glutamine methyltransferase